MIIQFNWLELNQASKIPDCHVILLFCLYINRAVPEVRRISSSHDMLRKKLNISNNYSILLYKNLLINSPNGIFSNYSCKEPQSYLTNCSFLHAKVSPKAKSEYLYILSQRSLGTKNLWIPDTYVEPEYWKNPFIKHENSKIKFTLEKQI